MPIGLGRFDQEAPRSIIAGLGNSAPVDPVVNVAARRPWSIEQGQQIVVINSGLIRP